MQQVPSYIPKKSYGIIPDSVAEPRFREDPEARPFHLSYVYYKDKLCELRDIAKNGPRKILEDFRNIGRSTDISEFRRYNIDSAPVKNFGEYSKLYSGLPPDAELRENDIQGSARLFYFVVDRICFLVTIKNKHFETKKVRR